MWLFSETGFVSAVQHRDDPDTFIIRARDRKSLEPLAKFAKTKIIENTGTDYPFRVFITRKQYAQWVAKQIESLDYTNYKSRMHTSRGADFCDALHDVWADMQAVSPNRKRRSRYSEDVWGSEFQEHALDQHGIPLGSRR